MPGRLRKAYKKWFWNTYDFMGTLIVANVLWVLCASPVFTLPASTAGLLHMTARIAAYQDVSVRDFFIGFRVHFWRSMRLCGVYGVCLAVLAANGLFYMRFMERWPWIGAVLGGGVLWTGLFVALTGTVTFPLLVQTEDPVWFVIKKGTVLVLDNMVFTGVIFAGAVVVLILGVVTGAGLLMGAVSVASVLCGTGLRELQKKYAFSLSEQAVPAMAASASIDQDFEESRGWRDLFRPWDDR